MTKTPPLLSLEELITTLSFMTKDAAYTGSNPERHGQRCVQYLLNDMQALASGHELEQIMASLAHYTGKALGWDAEIVMLNEGFTLRIFNPPCDIQAALRAAGSKAIQYPKPSAQADNETPTLIIPRVPAPQDEAATRVMPPVADDGATRVMPAVQEPAPKPVKPLKQGTVHLSPDMVSRLQQATPHGQEPAHVVGSTNMRDRLAEPKAPEQPAPKASWLSRIASSLTPKDKGRG